MSGRRRSPPPAPRPYADGSSHRSGYRDDGASGSSSQYRRRRSPSPPRARTSRYESDPRDRRRDDRDDYRPRHREADRYRDRDDDRYRDRPPRPRPSAYEDDGPDPRDRSSSMRNDDRHADRSARTSSRRSRSPPPPPPQRRPETQPPEPPAELSEGEVDEDADPDEAAMAAMMGFGGFTTTKGKKVDGNAAGTAQVKKERTWRQYMNRKGGFNRPLDKIK